MLSEAPIKVLLVEDEAAIALMLEDMLEDLGCETVASAARLDDAWAALQSARFDLAVLDVNLGGQSSFDLARALVGREIPVVFSTGYGSGGLPADLQDTPVLTKPFSYEQLRQSIELALRARSG